MNESEKIFVKKSEENPLNKIDVPENCLFTAEQTQELFKIFQFFMNPKSKLINVKDIIASLKTLGYYESHPILCSIITKIDQKFPDKDLDFPLFFNQICEFLGDPRDAKGRKMMFDLINNNKKEKLEFEDFKNMCQEIGVTYYDEESLKKLFNEMTKKKNFLVFEVFDAYIKEQYGLK